MAIEYKKVQSAAKQILTGDKGLANIILETSSVISKIVGSTLGPGGQPVLIERYEHNLPPIVTKDGVTVFKSLGFNDAAKQCIMEAARDAAVRTGNEAGDGTTTATILFEAIVRYTMKFCDKHPRVSKQKVVRKLEKVFREEIEPLLKSLSVKLRLDSEEGRAALTAVAKISANGDQDLAKAVIECFEIVGDQGNVTITETSGPSSYEVEEMDGYPIPMGYEDSCAKFYPKFINSPGTQTCYLEDPVFILYHGVLNDIMTTMPLLTKLYAECEKKLKLEDTSFAHSNVIFVAIGFSETVLATFATGFPMNDTMKIFPLVVPKSPLTNGQVQFIEDLSAITGAAIFDPMNKPLDTGSLEDLGPGVFIEKNDELIPGAFEASRFRSTIIGRVRGEPYETKLLDRIDNVNSLIANSESELDSILLKERLGKLTGGIAKLKVIGASNGELKEKRDRAEDAVCSVRGAIKYGCLPGGGWGLLKIISLLDENDEIVREVLKPALQEPVFRLLTNCGMNDTDTVDALNPILEGLRDDKTVVFDALENKHGDPFELGVLDAAPAVIEAIRNSISIASQLGTMGGIVCFYRDQELERTESVSAQEWIRNATIDENDR